MALQYVIMPLFEESYYSYSIALQDLSYVVSIQYNERISLWFMSLLSADSEPIVLSMALIPLYPISLDYAIPNMSGYFWLEPIADINPEQYKQFPDKLSQYYRMFYIYDDGE